MSAPIWLTGQGHGTVFRHVMQLSLLVLCWKSTLTVILPQIKKNRSLSNVGHRITKESSYRQESPARELCNFSKWPPCNHGTSTTRVIIGAPSRSKRGAARCIDQTFTLNVNSNAMRSTCASHLKNGPYSPSVGVVV